MLPPCLFYHFQFLPGNTGNFGEALDLLLGESREAGNAVEPAPAEDSDGETERSSEKVETETEEA